MVSNEVVKELADLLHDGASTKTCALLQLKVLDMEVSAALEMPCYKLSKTLASA